MTSLVNSFSIYSETIKINGSTIGGTLFQLLTVQGGPTTTSNPDLSDIRPAWNPFPVTWGIHESCTVLIFQRKRQIYKPGSVSLRMLIIYLALSSPTASIDLPSE